MELETSSSSYKRQVVIFAAFFALIGTILIIRSLAAGPYKEVDFNSDPGWEGKNNRMTNPACEQRKFDFGWSSSRNASGAAAGEIGGTVSPSVRHRAYYAKVLSPAKNLDSPLSASGNMISTNSSGSNITFGWFNSAEPQDYGTWDWRGANALALRFSDRGDSARGVFLDFSSKNNFAVDTLRTTKIIPTGEKFNWQIDYLPSGGEKGFGLIRLKVNGETVERALSEKMRADGASFDRFGLYNIMTGEGKAKQIYIDDLTLDGVAHNFSSDPGWEGSNNKQTFEDCLILDRHDFGWSNTTNTGSGQGEIGGTMWVSKTRAYYGDKTGTLGFNDRLYATGKIVLNSTHSDSDIPWIGWFNAANSDSPTQHSSRNLIGAQVGGTSPHGTRLSPTYWNKNGKGDVYGKYDKTPILTPKKVARTFWICYEPKVNSANDGLVTVGLLGVPSLGIADSTITLPVSQSHKADGATLDRFGILNITADSRSTTLYLDDLRYTIGPGDSGPADRCGSGADVTKPTVSITAPAANATVSGKVNVTANATDNVGVAGVQFMLDDQNIGDEDTTAPYAYEWDTAAISNDKHELKAIARDAAGNKNTTDKLKVEVKNQISDKFQLSGIVFEDKDKNGKFDGNDTKMTNRDVSLRELPNGKLQQTKTDADGNYKFTNLKKVDHRVSHAIPEGYERTTDDSRVINLNGNKTWDFGISKLTDTNPHEGKIIYGSDLRQYHVLSNKRQYVLNIPISICLQVRRAIAPPTNVADSEIDSITADSRNAWCYYEQELGLNFVRESGTPTVWLVSKPNGTKRHVGGLCANPSNLKKFTVFEVPRGETEGHQLGYHWFPTDHANACSELPG